MLDQIKAKKAAEEAAKKAAEKAAKKEEALKDILPNTVREAVAEVEKYHTNCMNGAGNEFIAIDEFGVIHTSKESQQAADTAAENATAPEYKGVKYMGYELPAGEFVKVITVAGTQVCCHGTSPEECDADELEALKFFKKYNNASYKAVAYVRLAENAKEANLEFEYQFEYKGATYCVFSGIIFHTSGKLIGDAANNEKASEAQKIELNKAIIDAYFISHYCDDEDEYDEDYED